MKKISLVLLIGLLFTLGACNKQITYELELEHENINLYIGDSYEVSYIATANGKETTLAIHLNTSSTKVALEEGSISGLAAGTADIMVILDKDVSIVKILKVTIQNPLVITQSNSDLYVGDSLTLTTEDLRSVNRLGNLTWTTSDPTVATVDNGQVMGVSAGNVTITVTSEDELVARKDLRVMLKDVSGIEIDPLDEEINIFGSISLHATILPTNADQRVTWTSSDEAIASIDENGVLTAYAVGSVTLTATSVANNTIQATREINIGIDPLAILASLNNPNPINQLVTTYGATERQQTVYGSVSDYFFDSLTIIESIAPITMVGGTGLSNTYVGQIATPTMLTEAEPKKLTRTGILHPETTYITYHDTGNNTPGANALMHDAYLEGSYNLTDRARSWHYTVDEQGAYHHVPDNEVTWQGDSYTSYAYSIGIETAVDFGSDLYATWHHTAQLMASLMLKYNIPIENIKQHYDWNGKNCPQTLRRNNLYPKAIELIQAEFMVAKYLSDYTITMTSLSPEYVSDTGRIIALPQTATRVGYVVRIQKDNYDHSVVLYSNLPGQDATTTPILSGTNDDLEQAMIFDQGVATLPSIVTSDDEGDIKAMRIAYNCLSELQRTLVTTLDLLESKELALHALDAVSTPIVINELFSSDNDNLSHGFVELFNPTNQDLSLSGYTLQVNNGSTTQVFTFASNAIIGANKHYLVQMDATNNTSGTYLPLPDAISSIHLGKNGFVALANSSNIITSATASNVVDFVGIGSSLLFEGIAPTNANQTNLSLSRWGSYDTNQNATDFKSVSLNPVNTNGEVINFAMTDDQKAAHQVDLLIIALPYELSTQDESKVNTARTQYNALSTTQKALVTFKATLEAKETEMEGLLDPNLQIINQAIAMMSLHITNDFVLPTTGGITWSYKADQDTSYFNITTGTYLKLSYEAKLITLVATLNSSSKEIVVNFGILEPNEIGIYYTGTVAPAAGGQTGLGNSTPAEQAAKVGFDGIAMAVDGKVYFVAEKSYIPLSAP
ncbi:MAG: Ig-like domain-containing protein, partial [Bacilli bacterium]